MPLRTNELDPLPPSQHCLLLRQSTKQNKKSNVCILLTHFSPLSVNCLIFHFGECRSCRGRTSLNSGARLHSPPRSVPQGGRPATHHQRGPARRARPPAASSQHRKHQSVHSPYSRRAFFHAKMPQSPSWSKETSFRGSVGVVRSHWGLRTRLGGHRVYRNGAGHFVPLFLA